MSRIAGATAAEPIDCTDCWAAVVAVIEPAMSEKFNQVEPNRRRSGWGDFDTMIRTWDDALDGKDWILGKEFTAADVMLGSSAIFLRMFEMLPETRNLDAYADRCMARPANQRAVEKGTI